MRKSIGLALAVVWLFGGHPAWAEGYGEQAELARAVNDVRVSLQKGLRVSEREGSPLSGKFELENGRIQLSVYTMKADRFSEVIVDHETGKVVKVEAITGGEDLTAAKAEAEAMAKATRSLRAAVNESVKANRGFRAVSIAPAVREGHPVADVTLVKGEELRTVSERLD